MFLLIRSLIAFVSVAFLVKPTLGQSFLELNPDIVKPKSESAIACQFLTPEEGRVRIWRISRDGLEATSLGRPTRVLTRLKQRVSLFEQSGRSKKLIRRLKRDISAVRRCGALSRECRDESCAWPTYPVNCTHFIEPSESINKYSNSAQSGDTVCIKAGTYRETLHPQVSGSSTSPVIFAAAPGAECKGARAGTKADCQVIIDGKNERATGVDLSNSHFIRVQGFEIKNHVANGITNFTSWYANDYQSIGNQIINNFIHHNGENGVDTENSKDTTVEGNEIFANEGTAIRFGGELGSKNLVGRFNNIHYNGKDGFQGGGQNILIEGNRMYDQFHTDGHQDAIDAGNTSDWIIRYNTISDFTQLIYLFDDGGAHENLEIYGNILFTDKYWTERGGEAPGIFLGSSRGRNITIHSNSCGWLGYPCARVYGNITNLKLYNNLMVDSGINVEIDDPAQVHSDYNLFFNTNSDNRAKSDSGGEVHSLFGVAPRLVNYVRHQHHDFRLQGNSPAINRGINLGDVVVLPSNLLDIAGISRPKNGVFDIGAYEY